MRAARGVPAALLSAMVAASPVCAAQQSTSVAMATKDPLEDTLYAVSVNGEQVSDGALLAVDRAGDFFAPDDELHDWRLKIPGAATMHAGREYHKITLPGIRIVVHTSKQSISLTVPPRFFLHTDVRQDVQKRIAATGSRSVMLGYMLDARHQQSSTFFSGFFDAHAYVAGGEFDSQMQAYEGTGVPFTSQRISTSWARDIPGARSTLLLGDSTSNGGLLGDSLRFIGVQYGTNFTMFPDIIVRPQPALLGIAPGAANLKLYANGVLEGSASVPVGPFTMPAPAYSVGDMTYDVIVKDVSGREYSLSKSYYADTRLLAPGIHSYAYSLGAENTGASLDSYGPLFAEGTERIGITNELTAEASAEFGAQRKLAAASAVWGIPHVGSITAGLGYEGGSTRRMLDDLDYEYVDSRFAFSAFLRDGPSPYVLLGLGQDIDHSAGVSLSMRGSMADELSVGYSHDYVPGSFSTNTLSLVASHGIGPLTFSLVAGKSTGSPSLSTIGFAISKRMGPDATAYASATSQNGKMMPQSGIQAQIGRNRDTYVDAQAGGLNGRTGDLRIDDRSSDVESILELSSGTDFTTYQDATVRGTVAFIGSRMYAPDLSGSPYALVETGYPGVPVYRNNLFVGRTDGKGRLFVPMLAAYEPNTIKIDPSVLPFGVTAETEKSIVPLPYSGNVVRFKVLSRGAVTFTLTGASGRPVAAGSTVSAPGMEDATVGEGGTVYLDKVVPGKLQIRVTTLKGRRCSAVVEVPASVARIPDLGSVPCR